MKVIISGAGVAGLTLATRLGAAGWNVVLLEPAAGFGKKNYIVNLFGKGYEAAERMSLVAPLREMQYRFPETVWVDERGVPVARLQRTRFERMLGSKVLTVMRGDLEEVLYATLPRSVELRFDCRVEEISLPGTGVRVRLASGKTEDADLLIGADGVHSRVRNLMIGDSEFAFHFMGLHSASFVFEDADFARTLDERCTILTVPNRQAMFSPLRDGRVAAQFAHRGESTAVPRDPLEELDRVYRPLGWLLPSALDHARRLPEIHYDYLGQVQLRRWSFGRVVLAGDACQCASPLPEEGASFAMHGARVLADELLRTTSLEEALSRYESAVKPVADDRQLVGTRAARWLLPASSWRLHLRNLLVRVANRPGMAWVLKPVIA